MTLSAIPIRRILGVPLFARIVAGLSRSAINLDPVVNAVPIQLVRLPPTTLQIAGMNCGSKETDKKDEAGKNHCPILASIDSKHSAVSKWIAPNV